MAPEHPSEELPAQPPAESEPARPARRPRTSVVVLCAALALVLVGSGLLLARMISTTRAWQDSSAGWQRLAQQGATDLATTQSALATSRSDLVTATAQLATAQARITDLANEKAQLGDTNASQRELADYQSRVSQAAGQVATALTACVTGQQKLIGYLKQSDQYDSAQLTQYGQDVATVCSQATAANATLQAELKK